MTHYLLNTIGGHLSNTPAPPLRPPQPTRRNWPEITNERPRTFRNSPRCPNHPRKRAEDAPNGGGVLATLHKWSYGRTIWADHTHDATHTGGGGVGGLPMAGGRSIYVRVCLCVWFCGDCGWWAAGSCQRKKRQKKRHVWRGCWLSLRASPRMRVR